VAISPGRAEKEAEVVLSWGLSNQEEPQFSLAILHFLLDTRALLAPPTDFKGRESIGPVFRSLPLSLARSKGQSHRSGVVQMPFRHRTDGKARRPREASAPERV